VLRELIKARGRPLSRTELLDLAWGEGDLEVSERAVDNVILHEALRTVATSHPQITMTYDLVAEIGFSPFVAAVGRTGTTYFAERAVLAAGAWSTTIAGLPRAIPVEPVRGQMLAYSATPLRRVVYGPTGYIVPRASGRTLIGATMERTGFDSATTPEGVDRLRRCAAEILPGFAALEPAEAWAGLRPISLDLQPILGADPAEERLVYSTRNGRGFGFLRTTVTSWPFTSSRRRSDGESRCGCAARSSRHLRSISAASSTVPPLNHHPAQRGTGAAPASSACRRTIPTCASDWGSGASGAPSPRSAGCARA